MAACIFCKIIKGSNTPRTPAKPQADEILSTGDIPCFKLFESDKVLAFLDINPLSRGHALVIPKFHGVKLLDIPDDQLSEILPVVKKLVKATGAENYNVLQNNGRIAHQEVDHVHFHMIPKPNNEEGMSIGWPQQKTDMDKLKELFADIKSKM
ncbi:Adenosine 5'-monophosphoramidase [Cadophora gregata f. sp. sojae]|nr:Adenosine 5'-monophosphoramidase [Cadophora gregata f. sp. sojae]